MIQDLRPRVWCSGLLRVVVKSLRVEALGFHNSGIQGSGLRIEA